MEARIQLFLLHVPVKKPVQIFLSYAVSTFSRLLRNNEILLYTNETDIKNMIQS